MVYYKSFKVLIAALACFSTVTCSPQGRNGSNSGGEEGISIVPPSVPAPAPAAITPTDPLKTGVKQASDYQPAHNVGYDNVEQAERAWEAKLASLASLASKGQVGGVSAVQALIHSAAPAPTAGAATGQIWGTVGSSNGYTSGASGIWTDPTMSLLKPYIQNVTSTYEETKAKWDNEVAKVKQRLTAAMNNAVAVRHPDQFQRRTLFPFFPFWKPSLFDLFVITRFFHLAVIFVVNTAVVGLTVGIVTKLLALLKLMMVKKIILIG